MGAAGCQRLQAGAVIKAIPEIPTNYSGAQGEDSFNWRGSAEAAGERGNKGG